MVGKYKYLALNTIKFSVLAIFLACTEKTYVTNPPPVIPDLRPPLVEWVSVSWKAGLIPPSMAVSDTVTLTLSATDESGIDSVKLYINGFPRVGWYSNPTDSGGFGNPPYAFLWNTLTDSDGVYSIEARAWDKAGNTGVSPALILHISNTTPPPPPDRTPPTIEWLEPKGYSELEGIATLCLKAFDNVGIDSIQVFKNGLAPIEFRGMSRSDSIYTFLWNTEQDSDGVYVLEAKVWDMSGNSERSSAIAVRVTNDSLVTEPESDRTPPLIRWVSPAPGSTVRDSVRLEFEVTDSSEIDSIQVFLDGELGWILAGAENPIYTVRMNSWRWSNGLKILEVRAYDQFGNIGIGNPIGLTIDNHLVIYVPDDYETIQGAINASRDGDTIMVRAGTYDEQLQFFDKKVSMVSESGPEETIIDGTGNTYCAWITGGQDSSMIIRGFTFLNEGTVADDWQNGILIDGGASPRIVNNIMTSTRKNGMVTGQTFALIRNNLFINSAFAISIAHSWGDFINNMIVNMEEMAIWDAAGAGQPLIPDYNLFWNFGRRDRDTAMRWGDHNVFDQQPLFEESTYRLQIGSPGIDQGDPTLKDLDGTRSDMGVHGGPHAYR